MSSKPRPPWRINPQPTMRQVHPSSGRDFAKTPEKPHNSEHLRRGISRGINISLYLLRLYVASQMLRAWGARRRSTSHTSIYAYQAFQEAQQSSHYILWIDVPFFNSFLRITSIHGNNNVIHYENEVFSGLHIAHP